MTFRSKVYFAFVVTVGCSLFLLSMLEWQLRDVFRNACYFLPAVLATGLKLKVRRAAGLMSGCYVFILLSFPELTVAETVVIGCVTTMVESLWLRRRVRDSLFAFSNMAIAIQGTSAVYHSPWSQDLNSSLIAIALSAITFFLLTTISLATMAALSERVALTTLWQNRYLFSLPYHVVGASVAWLITGVSRGINWQAAMLLLAIVFMIYRSYRMYLVMVVGKKKHQDDMAALQLRTIEALALAIEAKDHTTHDHLRRVQIYAVEIGKELGLNHSELEALRAAALLHDIGKLAVPEHIISKPGKLTPEEFEKMKIHPIVGAEILSHMKFPYPVVPIVLAHHERWDGKGYPYGLRGEEIPLGARILSAVDCLDALASDRQYRRAVPIETALEKVSAEVGKSYDPRVVEVLQKRFADMEQMTRAKSNATLHTRLSTNLKIERGTEPATGLQQSATPSPLDDGSSAFQFVNWISSARQEEQLLHELASDLGNTLSLDENLALLHTRLQRLVPYECMAVYIGSAEQLSTVYLGGAKAGLLCSKDVAIGQGLSGWVAEHQKPILNGNPAVEPGYVGDPSTFRSLRSALAVPLPCPSGVVSVLALYHGEKDAFTRDHLRILLAVSSKVGLTIENALKHQHLESSAETDFITSLPNARALFPHLEAEVARAKRQGAPLAVVMCDLDGFKQINDRFGHLEGNRVLRLIAAGLKEVCREYDYVARLGGDEFVVVMPGLTGEHVETRIESLRQVALRVGLEVAGEGMLSMSIGKAVCPADGVDAERLLAEADRLMYENKRQNKQRQIAPVLPVLVASRDNGLLSLAGMTQTDTANSDAPLAARATAPQRQS